MLGIHEEYITKSSKILSVFVRDTTDFCSHLVKSWRQPRGRIKKFIKQSEYRPSEADLLTQDSLTIPNQSSKTPLQPSSTFSTPTPWQCRWAVVLDLGPKCFHSFTPESSYCPMEGSDPQIRSWGVLLMLQIFPSINLPNQSKSLGRLPLYICYIQKMHQPEGVNMALQVALSLAWRSDFTACNVCI
jgi:hypothetical protein